MSIKKIRVLLWIFSLSSILLVYSQIQWIINSYDIQKLKFNENVKQVMNQVATELDQTQFLKTILKDTFDLNFNLNKKLINRKNNTIHSDSTHFFFQTKSKYNYNLSKDSFKIIYDSLKGQYWVRQVRTYLDRLNSNNADTSREERFIDLNLIAINDEDIIVDSNFLVQSKKTYKKISSKFPQKLESSNNKKDILLLDSLISANFAKQDLIIEYKFAVMQGTKLLKFNTKNYDENINIENALKVRLYSTDLNFLKQYLLLDIINSDEVAIKLMITPSIFTIILIFIMIITTYISLSTNFKQKKISEIKNDFINNMTHELKTPISTISLAAEALSNRALGEEKVGQYAQIIFDENKRLADQVEQILQLARIEKGEIQLNKEIIDLAELTDQVLESFKLHFSQKVVLIERDYQGQDLRILVDRNHIFNCLYNIIDNSIKYSGLSLRLFIKIEIKNDLILLKIRDNGIGMTKDVVNHIFEKFYRAPTGDLHDVKGYGIGLSYVNEIIKLHRAQIQVLSEVDVGTEIRLSFQRKTENEDTFS
jgi:two-component system, OmpR family, phosphate regulon sensor histidine kinase PhoR